MTQRKKEMKITSNQAWHIVKWYVYGNRRQAPEFIRDKFSESGGQQTWEIVTSLYNERLEQSTKREETFYVKTDPEDEAGYILDLSYSLLGGPVKKGKISDIED